MKDMYGLSQKQIDEFRNLVKKIYGLEMKNEVAAECAMSSTPFFRHLV